MAVGIAQGAEGGAEFAAAADEIVDTKLRDGAGDFIDRPALEGLFVEAEVGKRAFGAGDEETGGGVFGLGFGERGVLLDGFEAFLFERFGGRRRGRGWGEGFAIGEVFVEERARGGWRRNR